jgi:2-polyprenyl-3-methyl-5-hydroxy-6-metoxy-1,4-benzoquinol methylase
MNLEFETLNRCPVCGSSNIKFDFNKYDEYFKHEFSIFCCLYCGLYFVNPRIDKKYLSVLYDSSYFHGENWDDKTDYYSNYSNEDRLKKLEDLYSSHLDGMKQFIGRDNLTILDVGCGLGFFSYFARKSSPAVQITSTDIAPEAVNHLKEKGRNVVLGDILTADLPNEHFDVVYMREVLEHLYEPVKYMKRVKELLKKGGLFFYTTGNTDEVHDMKNWAYVRPAGHINYFNPRSVKKLFKKSGLRCYPRELLDRSLKELLKYCQVKIGLRTQQLPLGYRSN